jgi:hypothetical protein
MATSLLFYKDWVPDTSRMSGGISLPKATKRRLDLRFTNVLGSVARLVLRQKYL